MVDNSLGMSMLAESPPVDALPVEPQF